MTDLPLAVQNQGKLERGWTKVKLIRALALGEKTQAVLADEFGVTNGAISQFKTRHQVAIADMVASIEDEMAGIWVAKKTARLAEYQQDIEDINVDLATQPGLDSNGEAIPLPDKGALMNAKHRALKSVAEEMGQLPTKVQMDLTVKARHELVGVDLEDL